MQYLRDPFNHGLMESFATLGRVMPTGIFDNAAIDVFLSRLFAAPGRTNDFRKLGRKLFLVATNLDSGASVTFGAPGHDHVSISRAIEASSALPGLFPPVHIAGEYYVDGALNKTLHASVALDEGIDLLLCVNPLVPFDASKARRDGRLTVEKLNQLGLPLVLSQTFRAIIHSRMKVGMEKYRRQYPHADVVLFEPDREDADMFFANIFSYSQRKHLCAAAYRKTRQNLIGRAEILAPQLARHGITLATDRLARPEARRSSTPSTDPRPLHTDADAPAQGAADDARSSVHARPARALARRRALTLAGDAIGRAGRRLPVRRPHSTLGRLPHFHGSRHGGKETTPPHARAHPRNEPRSLQSLRRVARHDGRHRRRDEHQPREPLLPLPQQGRDHRRALRGVRGARDAAPR